MIYLVFRELRTRDGASIQFVIGKGTTDPERAKRLATLMNENGHVQDGAKILDCTVRHYVMEVEVEEGDGEALVKRGDLSEPLGGVASGHQRNLFCGNCSPEPLHFSTAVHLRVRTIGIGIGSGISKNLPLSGIVRSVDVLECPRCGHQVLR